MQDRFERFVVSITELHRYLQKLKELEMGQMDLKAGYTMCLYYLGKHPEGLTATQLTELCKEDKAAISRTLSQLSSKGLVSCELPEHKRSYRTLYYLTEEGNTVVKKTRAATRCGRPRRTGSRPAAPSCASPSTASVTAAI